MLQILTPGLQTTLQGAPRTGWRHYGIPDAGPADALSMALANRLVGNSATTPALEITLGGFRAEFLDAAQIAVTGAAGGVAVDDIDMDLHTTVSVKAGAQIEIRPPHIGMRAYLARSGGFDGDSAFGSMSTYLPAGLGGFDGRALQAGDCLSWQKADSVSPELETPEAIRPHIGRSHALRTCASAETHMLGDTMQDALFTEAFIAARQVTRMGFALEGYKLDVNGDGAMPSAPVYPGTLQCPPSGTPYLLGCDAQTTGGYPRIAQVARCDRHLLGQVRPGDRVQFLHRTPDQARQAYRKKAAVFAEWLPDFVL